MLDSGICLLVSFFILLLFLVDGGKSSGHAGLGLFIFYPVLFLFFLFFFI